MNEKDTKFEDKLANRKAAKELIRKNYHDPINAGYLELISSCPLAAQIDNLLDYYDEDEIDSDDIRPF